MRKAIYIHEPCPACEYAEDKFIPTIKDRYKLIEYDLRFEPDRNNKYVKMWSNVTNMIPTIVVDGKESVDYYIGVNGVKELSELCEGWDEKKINERGVSKPLNISPTVLDGSPTCENGEIRANERIDIGVNKNKLII